MTQINWFITGTSSGLGRELTEQLLEAVSGYSLPYANAMRSQLEANKAGTLSTDADVD